MTEQLIIYAIIATCLIASQSFDAWTTMKAIEAGALEKNPFMVRLFGPKMTHFLPAKIAFGALLGAMTMYLWLLDMPEPWTTISYFPLTVVAGATAGIALWNLSVIRKIKQKGT